MLIRQRLTIGNKEAKNTIASNIWQAVSNNFYDNDAYEDINLRSFTVILFPSFHEIQLL